MSHVYYASQSGSRLAPVDSRSDWNLPGIIFFSLHFLGQSTIKTKQFFVKEAGTRAGPMMQQRWKPLVDWSKSCKDKV